MAPLDQSGAVIPPAPVAAGTTASGEAGEGPSEDGRAGNRQRESPVSARQTETRVDEVESFSELADDLLGKVRDLLSSVQEQPRIELLIDLSLTLDRAVYTGNELGEKVQRNLRGQMNLEKTASILSITVNILEIISSENLILEYDANLLNIFDDIYSFIDYVTSRYSQELDYCKELEALCNDVWFLLEKLDLNNYCAGILDELFQRNMKERIESVDTVKDLLKAISYDVCPVCQEVELRDHTDFSILDQCTHLFCSLCAKRWLAEHNTCPMCRNSVGSRTTTKHFKVMQSIMSERRRRGLHAHPNEEAAIVDLLEES